jgi:hypothetical protein
VEVYFFPTCEIEAGLLFFQTVSSAPLAATRTSNFPMLAQHQQIHAVCVLLISVLFPSHGIRCKKLNREGSDHNY